MLGSAAQDDAVCREFATRLGVLVCSVDYRLAPEHPHPIPLHDCHDALEWLAGRDDVDESRIAIGGGSAGGGLAASLALLARARGAVTPAFQSLTYPMLDDRTTRSVSPIESSLRIWNSRSNRFAWTSYLGAEPGGRDVDRFAAPAREPELAGLPSAWIGVGTLDLFHDEDVAHAERLSGAGVACELTVVDGAFHGFEVVAPRSSVAQCFREDRLDAIRRGLGLGPSEPAHPT